MRENMINMWNEIYSMSKSRPYVFKTRLERALLKTKKYCGITQCNLLYSLCMELSEKMTYISDNSNHTSDGELRSYIVLKDDIKKIILSL